MNDGRRGNQLNKKILGMENFSIMDKDADTMVKLMSQKDKETTGWRLEKMVPGERLELSYPCGCQLLFVMVPQEGLEPPCPYGHQLLRLACLPFHHCGILL